MALIRRLHGVDMASTKAERMSNFFIVGLGGFLGAVMRFWMAGLIQRAVGISWPIGTFVVNVVGCFLIGYVLQIAETREWVTLEVHLLIVTGFLGAFTTFSTFSSETVLLVQHGRPAPALAYVVLHLLLGFTGTWVGQLVATR